MKSKRVYLFSIYFSMKDQEDFGRSFNDNPFDYDWGETRRPSTCEVPDNTLVIHVLIEKATGDFVSPHKNINNIL